MAGRSLKAAVNATIGALAVGLFGTIKLFDRRRAANFAAAFMRRVGPRLKEHSIGRNNLHAAYPEKSDAEIEQILAGVWDNLGRVAAEFAHLDEFHIEDATAPESTPNGITYTPKTAERYERIISSGGPTLGFTAHLANWEIPAVSAKLLGVHSAILYRRPNIRAISDAVIRLRAGVMGELIPTGFDAPLRLARLLESGVPVGMLVDQHFGKGVEVTFFGRPCKANPLIALLARQMECPIYGVRVVRLPDGNRFCCEITDPIEPPRDADGRIDISGTMQVITSAVEGWIREHPEQWLWLHRRWR
jgi:Kdo2-lipid IVA lauroyltransferase/acyltransferase